MRKAIAYAAGGYMLSFMNNAKRMRLTNIRSYEEIVKLVRQAASVGPKMHAHLAQAAVGDYSDDMQRARDAIEDMIIDGGLIVSGRNVMLPPPATD